MSRGHVDVIWGAGPLGLALCRRLVAAGRDVRLVTRSGRLPPNAVTGVMCSAADAADANQVRAACKGATTVYHCIGLPYPQWRAFPAIMRGFTEGAAGTTLVYGDNVYAYGAVPGPLHPGLPETATTVKGRIRAEVAGLLFAAHRAGRLRAGIVRASDFFGPGATEATMLGTRVFGRLLAGKPAQVVGNPDQPHSYTYLDDFAAAMIAVAGRDDALGQVWHAPNAPVLTTRDIVGRIAALAGTEPRIARLTRPMLALAGLFNPLVREVKEMLYEFEAPFVVDSSAFEAAFGIAATPWETSLQETLAWFRAQAQR